MVDKINQQMVEMEKIYQQQIEFQKAQDNLRMEINKNNEMNNKLNRINYLSVDQHPNYKRQVETTSSYHVLNDTSSNTTQQTQKENINDRLNNFHFAMPLVSNQNNPLYIHPQQNITRINQSHCKKGDNPINERLSQHTPMSRAIHVPTTYTNTDSHHKPQTREW